MNKANMLRSRRVRKTQLSMLTSGPAREQAIDRQAKLQADLAISTAPPNSPTGPTGPAEADFQLYVPSAQNAADSCNQHVTVIPTSNGDFLATWTSSSLEGAGDQRVLLSRSCDGGVSWTEPACLAGPEDDGFIASWSFPVVAAALGRVYMFYHKQRGFCDPDPQVTSQLWYQVSDDDGHSWSRPYTHLRLEKNPFSHPDPDADPNWIIYTPPIVNAAGEVMVGFTHAATAGLAVNGYTPTEIRFVRFDNILTADDPGEVTLTVFPADGAEGLRLDHPDHPGLSFLQEPSMQVLSDGRLFCVMRTATGYAAYAISSDHGRTWTTPRTLRYCAGGEPIKQPMAPCPLYKLHDGRYILIYHNNVGDANQGRHFMDWCRNRRPVYVSVAREAPAQDEQPLMFRQGRVLADNDGVPISDKQLTEIGTYTSLLEYDGKVYFFYPDRKHYLLGKVLGEDLLSDFGLPR